MLATKFRISKKKEIEEIFQNGSSFFCKILGLKTIKNNFNYSRFVIIVSKKVSKSSVERNKIKRKIRAIIIEFLPNFKENKDCMVIVFKPILKENYYGIKKDLEKAFKSQKLI